MGIPSYLVADALVVVLSQRLVRKLCANCKIEDEITIEECKKLGFNKGGKIYKATGCNKCNETGYKGRTVIYELLKLDYNHKSAIARSGIGDDLWKYHSEKKSDSFIISCSTLVANGVTSIEEFINATYSYNFK